MAGNRASEQPSKQVAFACERCRTAKRRCDGIKPKCFLCQRSNRECVYKTAARQRKRKYWDEDYVRSLENQVQALLALQEERDDTSFIVNLKDKSNKPGVSSIEAVASQDSELYHPLLEDEDFPSDSDSVQERSQIAMEELSVMMWRTNLGDGVTIVDETHTAPHKDPKPSATLLQPPLHIIKHCEDQGRIYALAALFFEHINDDHQFTSYRSGDHFKDFPSQSIDRAFLHSAILATGATFEHRKDSTLIGDAFAEFAESLVFKCFRDSPSLHIIQGLCILSWRALALGRDHFGWTFISMAAGMAVHLRLHVLALDEFSGRSLKPGLLDIQTFWTFYMTDRTAVSILGRNCVLPWRRVNVPSFETTFCSDEADLAQVSFAWQCKLWYMHDQNMDQIFSSAFEKFSTANQIRLLVSTHEALNRFFNTRDHRLEMTGYTTPKPVLLFHMAYQMAILVTMPPFLRLFAAASSDQMAAGNVMPLVLRSITHAALAMVRLVGIYRKIYTLRNATPLLMHHLLSAAIVHLMNTTTGSVPLKRHSTRLVRACVDLLADLSKTWPVRSNKSIKVIEVLAQRWGVGFALPPESSMTFVTARTAEDLSTSLEAADATNEGNTGLNKEAYNFHQDDSANLDEETLDFQHDYGDMTFNFADLDRSEDISTEYSSMIETNGLDIFNIFEDLNNSQDFAWLYEDQGGSCR